MSVAQEFNDDLLAGDRFFMSRAIQVLNK